MKKKAFTLIELLFVLVIIAIISGFVISKFYVSSVKKSAVRALLEDTQNCLNFLLSQYTSNLTSTSTLTVSRCIKSQYTGNCSYSGEIDTNTFTVSCSGQGIAQGAICTVSINDTNINIEKNCSGY